MPVIRNIDSDEKVGIVVTAQMHSQGHIAQAFTGPFSKALWLGTGRQIIRQHRHTKRDIALSRIRYFSIRTDGKVGSFARIHPGGVLLIAAILAVIGKVWLSAIAIDKVVAP